MRLFKPELQPTPRLEESVLVLLKQWINSSIPLELEIGAGNGEFAVSYSQQNFGKHLVSIEHTRTRASAFKNRAAENPTTKNLLFLHANAIGVTAHYFPEARLDSIFLLYPNPYPKKSDHHSRWFHLPFFAFLVSRLKPGGKLHLASNLSEYLEDALACSKNFEIKLTERITITKARTAFERKYLERGEKCEELVFVKN